MGKKGIVKFFFFACLAISGIPWGLFFYVYIFNRPNIVKAVLQIPLSLILSFIDPFPTNFQNIIYSEPLKLGT